MQKADARAGSICGAASTAPARDAAWLESVRRTYGTEPIVQYFDTPLVVDNAIGETIGESGTDTSK